MNSTSAVETSSQAVSPLLIVEGASAAEAEVVASASAAITEKLRKAPLPVRFSKGWVMVGWLATGLDDWLGRQAPMLNSPAGLATFYAT